MTSRTRERFPKEVIDSVVAHSKDAKKNVAAKRKAPAPVEDSSRPDASPPVRSEMSQTTPKVSADFEKIFSKVIGSRVPHETKPIDFSETYQRAFGRATAEKSPPLEKREEPSTSRPVEEAKPAPKVAAHEEDRKEGLSANYTTVFGRLLKDEDPDGTGAEIRESLKRCSENLEETKITPESVPPSGRSVFERLSHSDSAARGRDSAVETQETGKDDETVITPSDKPVRSGKSVFERLSRSNSQ